MGWKDRHKTAVTPTVAAEQPTGRAQLVLPMPGAEAATPDVEAAQKRARQVAQWLKQVEDNWNTPSFFPHPGHLMALAEKAIESDTDSVALKPAWVREFAKLLHDKLREVAAKASEAP